MRSDVVSLFVMRTSICVWVCAHALKILTILEIYCEASHKMQYLMFAH